jgi:hypothetical protein
MFGITRDLETKDEILDTIKSISNNTQENDVWRWEIIKVLVRHREGHLATEVARRAIIDLAQYMPDLFLIQAHMDEFQSNYEKEKDND